MKRYRGKNGVLHCRDNYAEWMNRPLAIVHIAEDTVAVATRPRLGPDSIEIKIRRCAAKLVVASEASGARKGTLPELKNF